jgi:hypothetical protein
MISPSPLEKFVKTFGCKTARNIPGGRRGVSLVVLCLMLVSYAPLWAEETDPFDFMNSDIIAPFIDHTPPGKLEEGDPIKANVTDNKAVADVYLHYRFGNKPLFLFVPMKEGRKRVYSALIPIQGAVRQVEYYIQAFDSTGNTSLRGEPGSPLRLTLKKRSFYRKPWFWTVVGLAAGFVLYDGVQDERPTPILE